VELKRAPMRRRRPTRNQTDTGAFASARENHERTLWAGYNYVSSSICSTIVLLTDHGNPSHLTSSLRSNPPPSITLTLLPVDTICKNAIIQSRRLVIS
jgi:hypothetical protein